MDVMPMNTMMEHLERRKTLIHLIKETHSEKNGMLFLCAGYEKEREQFYQESNFEYFFGLQEPALIGLQTLDGNASLYFPHYSIDRSVWIAQTFDAEMLASLGVDHVKKMGKPVHGYATGPFYSQEQLEDVIQVLQEVCTQGNFIFMPLKISSPECRWVIEQLCQYVPELKKQLVDISDLVSELRRNKSQRELEYLYHAAEITAMAQQAAAGVIKKGANEADVQAALEFVFTQSGATKAFASVVGSGVNSTILHYVNNSSQLADKGLVVVDIGASFNHYCSDVTRTYPISGTFSEEQKKVYQDVLDCQEHIAGLAKPGMYLRNKKEPKKCLNTLAHEFLQQRGYDVEKEFPHGIGHFVGLDVHDVGDYSVPLCPGDVITIEPGIYLRDKALGVRIEDCYWVVKDGVICLTEEVPKKIEAVQNFMKESRFTDDSLEHKSGPNEH